MMAEITAPARGDKFVGKIKGIGPTIEGKLHDAGILTFEQLASSSNHEIAAILEGMVGMTPEHIAKMDWTGKARPLARADLSSGNGLQQVSFTVELALNSDREVHHTTIRNVRNPKGKPGKWAGWDGVRLAQFIEESADLKRPLPANSPPVPQPDTGSPMTAPALAQNTAVQAELTVLEIQVLDKGKTTPTKIVRIGDAWGVQVKWDVQQPHSLPNDMQWVISVYLESIGKQAREYDLPAGHASINEKECIIEPDSAQPMDPGVYKMGVAITAQTAVGNPLPIAAFKDGGMVQFFASG